MSENDLELLAQAYAASRSAADRDRVCEAAMPMVRRLAASIVRRLPPHFTLDDLIGDGCVGLIRAADRYDPARAVSFEIWATRIVRGSILNGLRRMDAIPERVRRDARRLDGARWQLAQHTGAAPTDSAAAASLGLDDRKLRAVLIALRRASAVSLDAPLQTADDGALLGERVAGESVNPADIVSERIARDAVGRAVSCLPPRERLIIASFYAGGSTFRQIGGRLGISKQRVSQLHGRALNGLRNALAAHGKP